MRDDLERFVLAQEHSYQTALSEIRAGKKTSHWIWYISPQLKGLGRSYNAEYYGIANVEEAKSYLSHPILGGRLLEITEALLKFEEKDPQKIMGMIDAMKLRSCMTLFAYISEDGSIFHRVLEKYFGGSRDDRTLSMIKG
ncbi:MAG: DUF1810 domain-containing protein [Synergistaceae bacterium]|nr:DUF1810 domain-containing protein [Synergistaceae bacterium]